MVIDRDATIGANSTILPGVVVGEGAVVSAMSLVNRDVPPGAFVGGVPIRLLRSPVSEQLTAEDVLTQRDVVANPVPDAVPVGALPAETQGGCIGRRGGGVW